MPRSAHAILTCALALAAVAPAAAGPDRRDPRLPAAVAQVVALTDGSGVVLGDGATRLVRVTAAGVVERMEHPAAGRLRHAATRGPDLWVAGDRAVLHRDARGAWTASALAIGTIDPRRPPRVAPLDDHAALVLATVLASPRGPGTVALRVEPGAPPVEVGWFERFTVASAASDGQGAVWALIAGLGYDDGPDPVLGYLRFASGWTLWRAGEPLPLPGVETRSTATAVFDTLLPDGHGGALAAHGALGSHQLFHIDREGTPRPIAVLPPVDPQSAEYEMRTFAVDEAGDLLAFESSTLTGEPARLVRVDPDAPDAPGSAPASVPLPAWFADTEPSRRPRLTPVSLSAAAGVVWIGAGPVLLSNAGGAWTSFASDTVVIAAEEEQLEAVRTSESVSTGVQLTGALSFTAGVAAGGAASGLVHDDMPLTVVQTLSGSTAAMLPWIIATERPRRDRDLRTLRRVSTVATPVLGGLAAWGIAEGVAGSERPAAALLGAWGGAAAGTAIGIALRRMTQDSSPLVRGAVRALGLTLVGSLSTLGYQLAGGAQVDDF